MATRYITFEAVGSRSFDPEKRSMRAVISTGSEVIKSGPRGRFAEVLPSSAMEIPAGLHMPLLDGHEHYSARSIIGSVRDVAVIGDRIEATLILSRRPDVDPIAMDIADGHVRNVSIGYRVLAGREDTSPTGLRRITATRWEMFEVSIVGAGANPEAQIRSREISDMPEIETNEPSPSLPAGPGLANRAAINAEIRSIGALAGLDQTWIDGQIDADATQDAARAAAFTAMQARGPVPVQTARTTVIRDNNDPLEIRAAMSDALACRLSPGRLKLEGRARDFAHHRVLDMYGDLVRARGDHVNLRDQVGLAERAIGAHSTADFPLLLADAANKSLLANYQAAEPSYRRWAARRPFKDLKAHHFARIGDFPPFKKVGESGEAQYGSISENSEKVFAHSFNTSFGVTRDALINDDMSALADFSSMIARRAAADENHSRAIGSNVFFALVAAACLACRRTWAGS